MISRQNNEPLTPLKPINTADIGTLSPHDQKIVDFYNNYKSDVESLRGGPSNEITNELFTTVCNMLGIGTDIKTFKEMARTYPESYLQEINKGFRKQCLANHPDLLDDKKNTDLKEVADEVIRMLGNAREVLLAFPKQFLSSELKNLATRLAKLPSDEIEALVAEPATQKTLMSIDNTKDLMRVLTELHYSSNHEVFWSSPWVAKEFFPSLPNLIKTASDLHAIRFLLPESQKKEFWELPGTMELAVSVIHEENRTELPGWGSVAPHVHDLNLILLNLPHDKVMTFLNLPGVQEQLPNLIKEKADIDKILETLQTDESRQFILALPFVNEIMKEAEDRVKAKKALIEVNHPNLLKIQAAIKQCLKLSPDLNMRTEINAGSHQNPGYQTRIIGFGGPGFSAMFVALNTCSKEYGLTVKQTRKDVYQVLIIKENDPQPPPLDNDFATKLKIAFEWALPIEYHKQNLDTLKHLITTEGLTVEDLPITNKDFNNLKITGGKRELDALRSTLAELNGMVNTQCTDQDGSLILHLISNKIGQIPYKFYGAFKKSYQKYLQDVPKEMPQIIIEREVPPTHEKTFTASNVHQNQEPVNTQNLHDLPPEKEEEIDLRNDLKTDELRDESILFSFPKPSQKVVSLKLRGGAAYDETCEDIKNRLINSEPYKNLIAHMAESKKWRQINAYLVGIKSATTIEALIAAVKDDPKDVNFKITTHLSDEEKEALTKKGFDFEDMEPEEQIWKHEKSMRENTGNDWYGFFHRGRSQTEEYALELEELMDKLLAQKNKFNL